MSTHQEQLELDKKRLAIKGAYPSSPRWHSRVDKMSPNQVVAIYLRLKSQGKVE